MGGFEKVFEINRNFRNEGISLRHNPEFTMMESYAAGEDLRDVMVLTENLFQSIDHPAAAAWTGPGGSMVINYQAPFRRLTLKDAIAQYGGSSGPGWRIRRRSWPWPGRPMWRTWTRRPRASCWATCSSSTRRRTWCSPPSSSTTRWS